MGRVPLSLASFRRARHRLTGDERGMVTTFVAVSLPAMIGLAALAEFAAIHAIQNQLQATADAAALAAVQKLPEETDVDAEAMRVGALNMDAATHGIVVKANNVDVGSWDAEARAFAVGGEGDAVRVTAERSTANGNPLPLRFLTVFGIADTDLSATAIVSRSREGRASDACIDHGIVVRGSITMSSHNLVDDVVCIHAEREISGASHLAMGAKTKLYGGEGVALDSHNVVATGATIAMPDLTEFAEGFHNTGTTAALVERTETAGADIDVDTVMDEFVRGGRDLPPYLDGSIVFAEALPADPARGKLYVIDGNVRLRPFSRYEGVGIYATGDIDVGFRVSLRNVALASHQDISFAASAQLGGAFCDGGESVFAIAKGDITLASHAEVSGIQLMAKGTLDLASHLTLEAASLYSESDFTLASHIELTACENKASAAIVRTEGAETASTGRLVY